MNCPCCSGKSYEECCKPFHTGEADAPTAEKLMRSRFSAFAIPNGEYLMKTTLAGKRKFHNKKDLQEWGEINQWNKLEIVAVPTTTVVEFKAFYTDENGAEQIHHERSRFQQEKGKWFYVDGEFLS